MSWQRQAKLLIAIAAVGVAVAVVLAFRRTPPSAGVAPVAPSDPKALVESARGNKTRINRDKEDVFIEYDTFSTYEGGLIKAEGVKVKTVRAGGRTFTISGKHAEILDNESRFMLSGDVRIIGSDGMEAHTEQATYTEADALVRAPGPVTFGRGRLTGSGVGFSYAKNVDVLNIHENVVVRVAADEAGAGRTEIGAGTAEFSRADHLIKLNAGMKMERDGRTIEAASGVAHLSADEQRVEAIELRGQSHLSTPSSAAGGLKDMRGDSIDLKYRSDGETLEHVLITGAATVEIAGAAGSGDRVIAARTLEASLAPDGSTPTALVARDDTALTMPADKETPARSIRAQTLDGRGAPGQGLTSVRFAGGVQFVERGADVARSAQSAALDVTLAPGLKEIDEARFAQGVRFEEGRLRAAAAAARYGLKGGTLELSGSEPAMPTPQVVNDRISVYATRIDVTLSGPTVKATGAVKSELKPAAKDAAKKDDTKLPSMFKEDKLVAATAGALVYDGPGGKATYSGTAQLWQGDTSIKATEIVLDEKRGDLTASGSVVTSIALEQETKDKRKERVQTTASSREFQYQESDRRATYVGEARATGPQGDVTAAKIELYLKESGDELERAEAYETVTLRDGKREITGARMTYVADEQQYVITGSPVVIKDECGGETLGKRVTFNRRTDVIVVDGSEIRTQTRGTTKCS